MKGTTVGFGKLFISQKKHAVQTNHLGGGVLLRGGISWSLAPDISPIAHLGWTWNSKTYMYLSLPSFMVNSCRCALHSLKTATPFHKTLKELFNSESHRCKAVASAYAIFLNHKSDYMYIKQSWTENKSVRNYSQCHSRTSSRLYINVMVLYFCIIISLLFSTCCNWFSKRVSCKYLSI